MSINFCHALFPRLFAYENLVMQALSWLLTVQSRTSYANLRTKFRGKTSSCIRENMVPKTVSVIKKYTVTCWEREKMNGKTENQKQLFSYSILCL